GVVVRWVARRRAARFTSPSVDEARGGPLRIINLVPSERPPNVAVHAALFRCNDLAHRVFRVLQAREAKPWPNQHQVSVRRLAASCMSSSMENLRADPEAK